jgi:WD40 repeat protein
MPTFLNSRWINSLIICIVVGVFMSSCISNSSIHTEKNTPSPAWIETPSWIGIHENQPTPTPNSPTVTATVDISVTNTPEIPQFSRKFPSLQSGSYIVFYNFDKTSYLTLLSESKELINIVDLDRVSSISRNLDYILFTDHLYDYKKDLVIGDILQDCEYYVFSKDKPYIGGKCDGRYFKVYDYSNGKALTINLKKSGTIVDLALSPRGDQIAYSLVSGREDAKTGTYILDLDLCWKSVESCQSKVKGPFHPKYAPQYIVWSPEESFLAVGFSQIILINTKNGTEKKIVDYENKKQLLSGLAWSPDGKWIAYGLQEDQTASVYKISINMGIPQLLIRGIKAQVWGWFDVK